MGSRIQFARAHGAMGAVIAVEVVVELFQLSSGDGPAGPAAAAGRVWVLHLEPLDEIPDVLQAATPTF